MPDVMLSGGLSERRPARPGRPTWSTRLGVLLAAGAFLATAALLAAASLASCAGKARDPEFVPADYASWRKTTELRLDYPIPGHEDRLRVIRMNEAGFAVRPVMLDGRLRYDFPAGAVIAKEIYQGSSPAPGEAPVSITAMVKAPGDPRALGGWLWIAKDLSKPFPNETVFGDRFCVGCHANANERHPYGDRNKAEEFRDYVFFVPTAASPPIP